MTVTVTMDAKEIERNSRIYDTSKLDPSHTMWQYFSEMNYATMNLCMDNLDLLRNKNKLTELARKAIHESGYQHKKKASRSKQSGQGDKKKIMSVVRSRLRGHKK